MTDKELVDRFLLDRSEQHFSEIYDRFTSGLLRTALYLVRNNRMLAEDLVQEVWVLAVEKLSEFRWESEMKTWLTGILMNKFREGLRKERPTEDLSAVSLTRESGSGMAVDFAMDLKQVLLGLPDGYREILVLHDMQGFKHREIAEMLLIDEGTSKSQLFHARKVMRDKLSEYKH